MTKANILLQYMESRIKKEAVSSDPGPVITISREMGCPAKPIANKLMNLLNEGMKKDPIWRCLSNELLEESAQKLKVHPRYIKHIFTYDDRNMLDEILVATKKEFRYKSDRAIKNTIGQVIRAIGEKGHYIIVGRGGVAHTRHISRSLHIRLIAPLKWRVHKLMEHKVISEKNAIAKVVKGDKNRNQFLSYYLGDTYFSEFFDITLNCASFSINDCTKLIHEAFIKTVQNSQL